MVAAIATEQNPKIRYHGRSLPCFDFVCEMSHDTKRPVATARIFATVITISYFLPIADIIVAFAVHCADLLGEKLLNERGDSVDNEN